MTTTSTTTSGKSFDISKYTINQEPEVQTITIEETGDSFEVTIAPMSWAKRNQLISRFLSWDADGNTEFKADSYVRACLTEMIVDAPWGKTTESFLISIDSRLGGALEKLVPEAFNEGGIDVDAVKKE